MPKVPELKAVQPALGHGHLPHLLRAPLSTKRPGWDQPSGEAALGRQGTIPALEEWAVSLERPVGRACRNTRGTGRLGARAEQTGWNQWQRTATSYPLARTAAGPQGRVSRWGKGRRRERWRTQGQSLPCHQLRHYVTLGEGPLLFTFSRYTMDGTGLRSLKAPRLTSSSYNLLYLLILKTGSTETILDYSTFSHCLPRGRYHCLSRPQHPNLGRGPQTVLGPTWHPWTTVLANRDGGWWTGGEGAVWLAGPGVRGCGGKPEEQSWPVRLHVSQQLLLPTYFSPTACHRVLPTPDNCKDLDNGSFNKLLDQARVHVHMTVRRIRATNRTQRRPSPALTVSLACTERATALSLLPQTPKAPTATANTLVAGTNHPSSLLPMPLHDILLALFFCFFNFIYLFEGARRKGNTKGVGEGKQAPR